MLLAILFVSWTCGDADPQGAPQKPSPSGMDSTQTPPPGAMEEEDPFLDHTRFSRYDSLGITVVESVDSVWRGDGWWIDTSQVVLSVGVALGDTIYELRGVGLAVRLGGGGVAIYEAADGGTNPSLKVFDAAGRFRRRLGRTAPGPGELLTVQSMAAMPGDSILVYDPSLTRVTVFAPNGTPARMQDIPQGRFQTSLRIFPLPEGGLIGSMTLEGEGPRSSGGGLSERAPFVRSDSLVIVLLDEGGREPARLLTLPHSKVIVDGGLEVVSGYSPSAAWAPFGDHFFAGSSDRVEIGEYGADASLLRLIRAPLLDVPLDPDSVAALREGWLASLRQGSADARAASLRLAHSVFPELTPRFDAITADEAGNLWLGTTGSSEMFVIDRHGRLLGSVRIPPNRTVRAIGEDWVLMSRTDRLGVEFVEVVRLVKS